VAFHLNLNIEIEKLRSSLFEVEYGLKVGGAEENMKIFQRWLKNYFEELDQ